MSGSRKIIAHFFYCPNKEAAIGSYSGDAPFDSITLFIFYYALDYALDYASSCLHYQYFTQHKFRI
jgi:hypothetical protein